tara:strand:- start:1071 stop:2159 length:1089 start_codon:yes stop_codon:yes gene_type:complete
MGVMQGIWLAEQAMEKERLDQANLDLRTAAEERQNKFDQANLDLRLATEERLNKEWNERFTRNRLNDLKDFTLGTGSGKSSGNNGGTLQITAKRKNALAKLTNMFPENSIVIPQLVNANLGDLTNMINVVEERQKLKTGQGFPLGPDDIEEIFKTIFITTEESSPLLNVSEVAESLSVDLDSEFVSGVTWRDYLTKTFSPKTTTAVDFTQNFSPGILKVEEVRGIRNAFKDVLVNQVANRLAVMEGLISDGKVIDQLEYNRLKKAQKNLSLPNPSFGLATAIFGVDSLLNLAESYPLIKDRRYKNLFNTGIEYNSKEDLDRAINMGFVVKGEIVNWYSIDTGNVKRIKITEEIVNAARDVNP